MKSKELIWLEEIDSLVETDFAADMETKLLPKSRPYTQQEAKEMADVISSVYLIAHRIHCKSCSSIQNYEHSPRVSQSLH